MALKNIFAITYIFLRISQSFSITIVCKKKIREWVKRLCPEGLLKLLCDKFDTIIRSMYSLMYIAANEAMYSSTKEFYSTNG